MCGLTAIMDLADKRAIDTALLRLMNDSQTHRGPDEEGVHLEPGIGLGHRRLSIIDLAGGQQPLCNEDGSVIVVYNGEIYNFQSLAKELTERGHKLKTHCDTEVIVHAWEEWGPDCVNRFRGMFAFALWDRGEEILFLARDRLGIKPLYFGKTNDRYLVVASELKALLLHPQVDRAIDQYAVEDYFTFGYVPEPRTILKSVYKLEPGHYLVVKRGSGDIGQPKRYWDIPFERSDARAADEVEAELIDRLSEAVKIRMIAEVPLGAFLSGGVDSSAVVAMMAQTSDEPVNTCSISFGERGYDESDYAAEVSRRYGTRHHTKRVDADDFGLLDTLVNIYDEPYADSSAIPTYRVCQLARERVTVALSGDGGDENFAGYRRHKWHMNEEMVRQRLPQGLRRVLFGLAGRFYPKADWAPKVLRAKTTLEAIGRDSEDAYLHSVGILPDNMRGRLFSERFKKELGGYSAMEVFRRHMQSAPEHPLSRIQYLDMKTYLPGDILTKVDRASMAHSLEVRVPILDHVFVEWVSGLDPAFMLRRGEGKYVFKKALEPFLPRNVLYRPKMGFGVPLSRWFRGPLRDRVNGVLKGEILADSGFFDPKFMAKIADEHLSGLRDHQATIWALLMFEGFERIVGSAAEYSVENLQRASG